MSKPLHGVYAITDAHLLPGDRLRRGVEQALQGGAAIIQYRDKGSPSSTRLTDARWLRDCCAAFDRVFIINDDVELALRVGADGVHLGQTDTPPSTLRGKLPSAFLIGATCHADLGYAQQMDAIADYLAFGRFFPSRTKPDAPPAPLAVLTQARQQLARPLVAIGGITQDNAAQVIAAGAHMIAVVDAIFGQPDIRRATEQLVARFLDSSQENA